MAARTLGIKSAIGASITKPPTRSAVVHVIEFSIVSFAQHVGNLLDVGTCFIEEVMNVARHSYFGCSFGHDETSTAARSHHVRQNSFQKIRAAAAPSSSLFAEN